MDALSELLNQVKLTSHFYYSTAFRGDWGVKLEELDSEARFHIVTRGSFFIEISSINYKQNLNQGDIIIIFDGLEHNLMKSYSSKVYNSKEFSTLANLSNKSELEFGDKRMDETNIICGHFSFSKNSSHSFLTYLPKVIHLKNSNLKQNIVLFETYKSIYWEAKNFRMGSKAIINGLSQVLFVYVFREYIEQNNKPSSYFNLLLDKKISELINEINKDLSRKWTLKSMAALIGMSRTSFSKKFKEISGITPLTYLTDARINKAKVLLTTTELSISEVGVKVGYISSEHFQKSFKKITKNTPSAFKKQKN